MDAEFWHKLWDTNNIGFHNKEVNQLFLENFPKLELKKNTRIFIPLCGKTVDIKYLLDNGYRVVGIELNENAVKELFSSLRIEASITTIGSLLLFSAENIDIFVGDIFELNKLTLGKVDIIYDRGAIVALPSEIRKNYTLLLVSITNNAPQLIITYEYEQNLMEGPPFSVKESQLKAYYNDYYNLRLLEVVKPKAFNKLDISEAVWSLSQITK
jgi:thiopurine S-methyltransferase